MTGQPQVLVSSTTGLPGTGANLNSDGTAATGYHWVVADYLHDANIGIKPATTGQFEGQGSGIPGAGTNFYVLDSSGKALDGAAVITAIGNSLPGAVSTACGGYIGAAGSASATTSACQAALRTQGGSAAAGWTVVQGNVTDPALNNPSNQTFAPATQAHVFQATDKSATTTVVPGGAVYANNINQTTAIGAGGVSSTDAKGNNSLLTGGMLNLTNGANPKAGITLDATVDPVITVTNGGGPLTVSKTVIDNGSITSTEGRLNANAGSTVIDGSSVHASTPVGLVTSNDVFLTGNGLRFNNTAGVDTITMSTSTGNIATVGSLSVGNGMTVTGVSTFKGTGANAGTTVVSGGSVAINGGAANSNLNGNINTLAVAGNPATGNPGALNVNGGAVINNGLEVNNGLRVTGPSQGQGPQTIDMGGNRVQDVATPIFGTDAANKAYVDRGLNKAYEGTAIALAISQPIIGPNQTFAIRAGWGNYESENAFGLSAAGIIGRDWFWNGSTVALDGGVGWGSNNSVAGKAGITLAFGPGYAAAAPLPLK